MWLPRIPAGSGVDARAGEIVLFHHKQRICKIALQRGFFQRLESIFFVALDAAGTIAGSSSVGFDMLPANGKVPVLPFCPESIFLLICKAALPNNISGLEGEICPSVIGQPADGYLILQIGDFRFSAPVLAGRKTQDKREYQHYLLHFRFLLPSGLYTYLILMVPALRSYSLNRTFAYLPLAVRTTSGADTGWEVCADIHSTGLYEVFTGGTV